MGLSDADSVAFEQAFARHAAEVQSFNKGKESMSATDWAQQFDQFDHPQQQTSTMLDPLAEQFESVWQQNIANTQWDADFLNGQDDAANAEFLADQNSWMSEFSKQLPSGEYHFEQQNPYLTHPDPLSEAMRLRESPASSLQQTALALEAAVQREQWSRDAQVWTLLGEIQAENEKEIPAIRALEKAIELDPMYLSAYMVCHHAHIWDSIYGRVLL